MGKEEKEEKRSTIEFKPVLGRMVSYISGQAHCSLFRPLFCIFLPEFRQKDFLPDRSTVSNRRKEGRKMNKKWRKARWNTWNKEHCDGRRNENELTGKSNRLADRFFSFLVHAKIPTSPFSISRKNNRIAGSTKKRPARNKK